MSTISNYEQCGFTNNTDEFEKIMSLPKLKEVHIDIYSNEPYMLLLRAAEKNIIPTKDNERIILSRKDKKHTVVLNILADKVEDILVKRYSDIMYEFVFTVHDFRYKLLVSI